MDTLKVGNARFILVRYALCLLSIAAAVAVSRLLQDLLPGLFVFVFLGAVVLISCLEAKGPAVLAILLSTLAVAYFLPPANSLAIDVTGLPLFFAFVGCALVLSWLSMQ